MERREPNLTPSRSLFREFVDDATGILISERREVTLKNLIWGIFGLDAFMILFLFRIRKWCQRWRIPLVGRLLRGAQLALYGIELGIDIELGRAVYFVHSSGVVVGGRASVGAFTRFYGSNTVGAGKDDGEPVIGSRVMIGAGARLLGSINIGDNVTIGANAVVLKDVPPGKTMVGIPARERPVS